MSIEIREHVPGKELDVFVRFPHELYQNDPHWVPPLDKEIRDRLSPQQNPFFRHAQVALFTAWKNGKLVGRCSAQVDHEHLRIHKDNVGFLGFVDTIDDAEVLAALSKAAERWLRARGLKRMRGPMSLSINEEVGMLVEGFDSAPMIMMPYHYPYQNRLMESVGFQKAKDLLAWRYEAGDLPKRALDAWHAVQAMSEVQFRAVSPANLKQDLPLIMEVFNDAWKDNWGFVPATAEEVEKAAQDFKLILDPALAYIVDIHGQAAAICVALPNLNAVIQDLQGKLTPLHVMKLLWRLKVKRPSSARLMMLGVRKEIRQNKKYGGLSMAMYVETHKRGTAKGYTWGELSWTLEDNTPVNLGIRAMGGKVYKRYRVYEKVLGDV